jgi:hypothetical protein
LSNNNATTPPYGSVNAIHRAKICVKFKFKFKFKCIKSLGLFREYLIIILLLMIVLLLIIVQLPITLREGFTVHKAKLY